MRSRGLNDGTYPAKHPQPVADERSAQREARLHLPVLVLGKRDVFSTARIGRHELQRRPQSSVEHVPRPIDERVAVPRVGAALRDDVQDAAGRTAVLGAVTGGLDLHFVYEVRDEKLAGGADDGVGRFHAVDDDPVLGAARAVIEIPAELPLVVGPGRLVASDVKSRPRGSFSICSLRRFVAPALCATATTGDSLMTSTVSFGPAGWSTRSMVS